MSEAQKVSQLELVFAKQTEELREEVKKFDDGRYLGMRLSKAIILEYRRVSAENAALSERLREAESVIRKYKDMAWVTGGSLSREYCMAAETYLSKTPKNGG